MEIRGRYVVNVFVCESDLINDQATLDPSMDVSDSSTSLRLHLNIGTSEASTPSKMNFSSLITRVTFFTILVESSPVAQRNSKFCKNSFNASVEKGDCMIDCMLYGLDAQVFTMSTADGYTFRYCVPMDNQRPQLDLKFYKDICPNQNGVSS